MPIFKPDNHARRGTTPDENRVCLAQRRSARAISLWCCEPVSQSALDAGWHNTLWSPARSGKHVPQFLLRPGICSVAERGEEPRHGRNHVWSRREPYRAVSGATAQRNAEAAVNRLIRQGEQLGFQGTLTPKAAPCVGFSQ